MSYSAAELRTAHASCSNNRAEIERSALCGCFYCLSTYPARDVEDWVDDDCTALCPKCPVDAVIGDASGWPVSDPLFLSAMYGRWFGGQGVSGPEFEELVTLYRPIGSAELALVEAAKRTGFPPRLPEQPIFYPVTNEAYARQIARDWNARHNVDRKGYVTRFRVLPSFLSKYERKIVGGSEHEEYWIPAEDLEAFNDAIVGLIEVIASYDGEKV